MKFRDFLKKDVSLIGKIIFGKSITPATSKEIWDGYFECRDMELTSLKGAPLEVKGVFNCSKNRLTTLEGAPRKIGDDFNCSFNDLTSLVGSPSEIRGNYFCTTNRLTNLKDIHKIITRIDGELYCYSNQIKSHVLGLLLIQGLVYVEGGNDWSRIVNKYLGKGRAGLIDCQNELIDAGLEECAQL